MTDAGLVGYPPSMSLLSNYLDEKEFDVRVIQRNMARGLVLQADLDKHVKKLPDDTNQGEWVNVAEIFHELENKSKLRN